MTIPEALHALRQGEISPVELTEACLRRIDETDDSVLAWTLVDAEGAMEQARRIDASTGSLAGIPIGIKDIFDVEGLPTTASSKVLEGNIARADAPSVVRLRRAGAVIMGKTNTHEFAYGFVSAPTRNPWDLNRIPGGSSGGSAAAVATSQCLGALGSDTGGSVRVPPALCGVCGLKPRPGMIPIEGVIPLAATLDVVGPIERTVRGLALIWDVLAEQSSDLSRREFTIGIPTRESLSELDPRVGVVFDDAVEVLGGFAKLVHEVPLPSFESFDIPRGAILMTQALEVHKQRGWWPAKADLYGEEIRDYLTFTEGFFTPEVIEIGKRETERLVSQLMAAMNDVDFIVTPTTSRVALTHEEAAAVDEGGLRSAAALTLGRYVGPVNTAGLPALSVPCGFSPEGLPVGLQFIGRDEESLMRVGHQYQQETSWTELRPPVLR